MREQHPVSDKDIAAYNDGYRDGHLDRLLGIRFISPFVDSYSLNRYVMYYGAGYRNGWYA